MPLERFGASFDARASHWLALLRDLVDQNSFSDNVAGVDAVRARVRAEFEALGLEVDEPLLPSGDSPRPRAAHLVARRRTSGAPRVLLIAHLDTVFPENDTFRGFTREGELLRGPGVGDIKGGIVAILATVAALRDAGVDDATDLTIFMNSDEECGSHSSRRLLMDLARDCDLALGFEPAFHPAGASVIAPGRVQHVVERKGCGRHAFKLTGVAAHAGGAHHLGASAIEALARKVVDVHALTDAARGVTTNVGLVGGGRSANTVAPAAWGEVDFRYRSAEDGAATDEALRGILCRPERVNTGIETPVTCELEPGGGALWPPLLPTQRSRELSRIIIDCSREAGIEAEAIARGGASDAAHAAAAGIPAVCGLGPVTAGIHTSGEHTCVPALRNATLVAALLLTRLAPFTQQRGTT